MMLLILFTMFFSGGMIPFYLNMKDLHLTNSLWGLIIPFLVNTYNLVILRTSFESIPESLIEAAKIDGAGHHPDEGTLPFAGHPPGDPDAKRRFFHDHGSGHDRSGIGGAVH